MSNHFILSSFIDILGYFIHGKQRSHALKKLLTNTPTKIRNKCSDFKMLEFPILRFSLNTPSQTISDSSAAIFCFR